MSEMYKLPSPSTTTEDGQLRVAANALPPSPPNPCTPLPTTVVMMPVDNNTVRILLFEVSAMYSTPPATATPLGNNRVAAVAEPPSPPYPPPWGPVPPDPAKVEMMPALFMHRTRWFTSSAIKRRDVLTSYAMPNGYDRVALVALPPSPENPGTPVPATVVMVDATMWRTRQPSDSEMNSPPSRSNASATGLLS